MTGQELLTMVAKQHGAKGMTMSAYYEEAAAAHGAMNPTWRVTFEDGFTGETVEIEVRANERQEAINKATYRLNTADLSKPAPTLYFKTAQLV